METISGGRYIGKTKRAIEIASKEFAYIICRSEHDASRIFGMAQEMSLDIPFPLSYNEFLQGRGKGRRIRGYVFDDAKHFLQYISDFPIFAAVWDDDDDEDKKYHNLKGVKQ